MGRTRTLLPLLALSATLLASRTARADERAEARRHFRAGIALVSQRQFAQAIAEFEEANRILPNVNVLFNIARAYADDGQYERAVEYYQRYLTNEVPDRAAVEATVRDLERRLRERTPTPVTPTPTPDTQPAVTPTPTPDAQPVTAPAGPLTADQVAALRSAAQTILTLTQGGAVAATPTPTPTTTPSPAPTPPEGPVTAPTTPAGGDDTYEDRVVTATLSAQSPLDSPNALTVITAQDIRLSGITAIPELLRRAVGVDVMALDSSDYQVGIRGFNRRLSSRVLVLIDGRSVDLDFIGLTLWPVLPVHVEEIERIEVIRGPGSALYGADAYSGVVNIITRAPGEGRSTVSVGAGNGARLRGMAMVTGRAGNVSFRAAAGYERAQTFGRLVGSDDVTFRVDAPDLNLAQQGMRADLDLSTRLGGMSLRGGATVARDTIWFNAIGPLRRFFTNITFTQPWAQLSYRGFTARAFANLVDCYADEYLQRVGVPSLAARLYQNVFDLELRYARDFQAGSVPINLIAGASYRLKHITWNFLDGDHALNHFAGYVQGQAHFTPSFTALASFRVDVHPVLDAPVLSPRLAVIYKPTPRRSLRLSGGTSFRTPTMMELYLDLQNPTTVPGVEVRVQGGEVYQNGAQRLRAESSISVDVGFQDQTSDVVQYELNAFYTRGTDLIELGNLTFNGLPGVANPGGAIEVGRFHFVNNPFATSMLGAEAALRVTPIDGLDLYGNYTLAFTQHETGSLFTGDQRTPQHKFNVGAQLRTRAGIDLSVDGHYVSNTVWSEQDFDASRGVVYVAYPLDAYFQLNARVGWRAISDRLELGVTGFNLTDNRARQHPFGAPLGARVLGTVTFRY